MNAIRNLAFACAIAVIAAPALAQSVKIKQGMLNVPALSPLWLLPDEATKHGIEIEMVMFQRFADARTAHLRGHPDHRVRAAGYFARAGRRCENYGRRGRRRLGQ